MRVIQLVLRCSTGTPAPRVLELARRNVRPSSTLLVSRAPTGQLQRAKLGGDFDYTVILDDDCLLLEDIAPFLERNQLPWIEAILRDRSAEELSGGLRIIRRDVIEASADVASKFDGSKAALDTDLARLSLALKTLGLSKQLKCFDAVRCNSTSFDHDLASPFKEDGAPRPKVFGIGLSRTGTNSLTLALQLLGIDVVHYPTDPTTFGELSNGRYRLSLLRDFDGITDITAAPFYPQLDSAYPGSKFILTLRDRAAWLESCRLHWQSRPAFARAENQGLADRLRMRQFLRAAVYGCYEFQPERFSRVYDQHVANVRHHFRKRGALLEIDICAGQGWKTLCDFLELPYPNHPFPHEGRGRGPSSDIHEQLNRYRELSGGAQSVSSQMSSPPSTS